MTLTTTCEVCGRRVFKTWFALVGDQRLKCGRCVTPSRIDEVPPQPHSSSDFYVPPNDT
jgi:hypothetical protein